MTIYSTLHQVLYNLYIVSVLKGRHYCKHQSILRNVNAWDDPGLQVACHHPLCTPIPEKHHHSRDEYDAH